MPLDYRPVAQFRSLLDGGSRVVGHPLVEELSEANPGRLEISTLRQPDSLPGQLALRILEGTPDGSRPLPTLARLGVGSDVKNDRPAALRAFLYMASQLDFSFVSERRISLFR